MIAIFVVSLVLAYLVVGGAVGAAMYTYLENRHRNDYYSPDNEFPAFFAGLFWPVVLPACLGIYLSRTSERRRLRVKEQATELQRSIRELEKDTEIGQELLPQNIKRDGVYRSPDGSYYVNGVKVL